MTERSIDLDALRILAKNDIDGATQGIGAVDRGRSHRHYLNPFEC